MFYWKLQYDFRWPNFTLKMILSIPIIYCLLHLHWWSKNCNESSAVNEAANFRIRRHIHHIMCRVIRVFVMIRTNFHCFRLKITNNGWTNDRTSRLRCDGKYLMIIVVEKPKVRWTNTGARVRVWIYRVIRKSSSNDKFYTCIVE